MTDISYYSHSFTVSSSKKSSAGRPARRSARLKLTVPVLVHGKELSGKPFREVTRTLAVSLHGGLLLLAATVEKGQILLLENKSTRKEQECRVSYVGPAHAGKWSVGVEFTRDARDFWRIDFPNVPDRQSRPEK